MFNFQKKLINNLQRTVSISDFPKDEQKLIFFNVYAKVRMGKEEFPLL